MQIQDIVNSIYFRTKTNSSSFLAADMLLYINNAYDRVVSLILSADSKWQFDDSNQTDLPIATAALVADQADYALATSHLTMDRIEILNSSGETWRRLFQIDQQQLKQGSSLALDEYQSANGEPNQYDLIGNSIILYPTPNYSLASALKVYFTRGGTLYTSAEVTTGTKVPGFISLFHDLISLWTSYNYAIANGQNTANGFFVEIQRLEKDLEEFYGKRDRDVRPRFTVSTNASQGNESGRITFRGGDSNE